MSPLDDLPTPGADGSTPANPNPAGGGARRRGVLGALVAALGVGGDRGSAPAGGPTDLGTTLAQERTSLAMERTYWAAERTLMGWIRTALSMISFGFTIGKIGEALRGVEVRTLRGVRVVSLETLAYLFVSLGTLALAAAAVQYAVRVHALRARGLRRQPSIAFAVAIVLTLVGAVALTALVANL